MSLHDAPIYIKQNTVQRIDLGAGTGNSEIREDLRGPGWVRLKAVGGDVQCFLTTDDTAAVTMDELATAAEQGYDILDGQAEDFQMTSETHIAWASSGAGHLVLMKTNKGVGR